MKKITIILTLLISISINAQTLPTVKTYKQQDSVFWKNSLQLIKPQITTGILYSKVTPFSNLFNFNTTEYNTADAQLFKQALSELHRASDNQSKFISIKELKTLKKNIQLSKANQSIPIVEIGVLNTSFNFLYYDEKNEDNGGLKFTNKIYTPIAGKQAVFEKHICLISPQQEMVISTNNGVVSYRINNAFYFNKDKHIKTVTTNFASNTTFTLVNNETVNTNTHQVTYTDFGEKIIEFNITYTDNTTLTTYAKIQVINPQALQPASPLTDCTKTNVISYTSLIPYKSWDEQTATYGKLEYKIFFANNNLNGNCDLSRIKKPFIVIDGFDPGDKRRIELDDCQFDPICQKINENVEGNFVPNDYKSIYSLMQYGVNPDNNLVFRLQEKGYDVIIINLPTDRTSLETDYEIIHDYGADFIQRNAMTLSSFIKDINTKLTDNNSTEELVVVGPSMGGQITRYALAYMEKQYELETDPTEKEKWYHNTRLWLSMDSPHQGANIPLAIQGSIYFMGYINGNDGAKTQYKQILRSPAAKQMLIDHYDYSSTSTSSPYFTNYQADLVANGLSNSNGYPTLSRNIAMVNGSIAGIRNADPAQRFLDMRGYIDMSWWFFNWTINLMTIKNNYQQDTNQSGMVFDVRAYRKDWNFYNSLSVSQMNTHWQGSLDVVPGGYFNSGNDLKEELVYQLKDHSIRRKMYVPSTESGTVIPHSFIPTHSALDTNGFSNWYQPITENLVCTGQTPFNNYYGAENNTDHVSFTQESKDWLFAELDADPVTGPFPLPSVYLNSHDLIGDLIGDNTICNGETKTYYFEDCKVAGNVIWSTSSNLDIDNETNTSITVIPNMSATTHTITAEFEDGTEITKMITGKPYFRVLIDNSDIFPTMEVESIYNSFSEQNIQNVSWHQTGGTGTLDYGSTDYNAIAIGSPVDEWFIDGYVRITNSCGYTDVSFHVMHHSLQQKLVIIDLGNNIFKVKNIITNETQIINNVKLYNAYGIEDTSVQYQNNEININNSQSGSIKIIKVEVDDKILFKRVIVD